MKVFCGAFARVASGCFSSTASLPTVVFSILLSVAFLAFPLHAQTKRSCSSDFDKDGLSDFVLITSNGNVLSWNAFKSDGSAMQSLGQFGRLGHDIALGDWLGTGAPQPATVSVTGNDILWRIFSGGVSTLKHFGKAGETALAGGDFNGDGVVEAVIVSGTTGKLTWKIHPSLFTNTGAAPAEVSFGRAKDIFFFYNPDGQGDRLATITRKGKRAFLIRHLNPANGKAGRKLVEQSLPSAQFKQRPLPLHLSTGQDALLFFQKRGPATIFSLLRTPKKAAQKFRIKADGDVLVGNFAGDSTEEVAVQSDGGFLIYDPGAKALSPLTAPAGIAVDEVNINRVGTPASDNRDDKKDEEPSTPPTDDSPPLAGLSHVCATRSAIAPSEMLIKSEISDHIPGIDPRATGYTLVCGRICPRNQSLNNFFYADGSYAGSVAYYGRFHGNNQPRLYGATGQAPQHFAKDIAAKASTIGNGKLYMQMSSAREGSETSCKEFNPTGRNGSLY